MTPFTKKEIIQNVKVLVLAALLVCGVGFVHGWTNPASTPPNCSDPFAPGCSAPFNVGVSGQIKQGGLTLGAGLTPGGLGFVALNGNAGIGTSEPSQMLDVVGYSKSRTGFCINDDCITAWPSGGGSGMTINAPTGAVMPFNLSTCPAGWSPFTDAAGRMIIGIGQSNAEYATNHTLGQKSGAETHTQLISEMPLHNHSLSIPGNLSNSLNSTSKNYCNGGNCQSNPDIPQDNPSSANPVVNNSGGAAMNIMNPYVALLYCIKS